MMARYIYRTTLLSLYCQSFSLLAPRLLRRLNRVGRPSFQVPTVVAQNHGGGLDTDVVASLIVDPEQVYKGVASEKDLALSLNISALPENLQRVDPPSLWTRQLWLDLRGTSLLPSEAASILRKLQTSELGIGLQDRTFNFTSQHYGVPWDEVLLSEEMFHKAVNVANGEEGTFMFSSSNGDLVATHSGSEAPALLTIGSVLSFGSLLPFDPLLSLDVTSKGGWLLLHCDEAAGSENDSLYVESVGNLLDILASTFIVIGDSSLSPTPSSGGLAESISPATVPGGVAVRCNSESTLVQMNAALAKSICAKQSSSTASGILISNLSTLLTSSTMPPLRTALVLPFDVQLWTRALELKSAFLIDD